MSIKIWRPCVLLLRVCFYPHVSQHFHLCNAPLIFTQCKGKSSREENRLQRAFAAEEKKNKNKTMAMRKCTKVAGQKQVEAFNVDDPARRHRVVLWWVCLLVRCGWRREMRLRAAVCREQREKRREMLLSFLMLHQLVNSRASALTVFSFSLSQKQTFEFVVVVAQVALFFIWLTLDWTHIGAQSPRCLQSQTHKFGRDK